MDKFNLLREKFPNFIYHDYSIAEDSEYIYLEYIFEIEGLEKFNHKIKIDKKSIRIKSASYLKSDAIFMNLVFNLGMLEIVSYIKSTCSKNIIVKCGYFNDEQKGFFKKIYYKGLGEFRYINNIKIAQEEMFEIDTKSFDYSNMISYDAKFNIKDIENETSKFKKYSTIIPIGGGKDSVVTLELLKNNPENICFVLDPRGATVDTVKTSGMFDDRTVFAYRTIDKKLIELNSKGYLNGHTPFSAMLAFLTYIMAYLTDKRYIALSNESSANVGNFIEEEINHQYSKSIEFENDFREYADKYLGESIKYFSFLRPLSEIQIAMMFSKFEKYHSVFKSCNKGSKENIWCRNCSKCLFVYSMISPFLSDNQMIRIFGENLFEKKELENTFLELCGKINSKPFDCVGTYEEMRYAVSLKIQNLKKEGKILPYLLAMYDSKNELEDLSVDILSEYIEQNNLEEYFESILKRELKNDTGNSK